MPRSPLRLALSVMLAGLLAACSGGTAGIVPAAHRVPSGKLTAATFTIKWTNPTATAAMRRKDTISPAAQSITVAINGKSVATATRGNSASQQIALDAPVGTDQFLFNVYDQPAGQGHLLGSAQVNQQIVDGAANNVSAAIQALCTVTNVSVSDAHGVSLPTYGASTGILARTLQSLVLMGQFVTTLAIEPEDVDGDVIIAGTGGTVPFNITSGAFGSVVDGSHIALIAQGGSSPTTPAGTLTVSAAGCPATTVALKESPAIYAQTDSETAVLDWYGDFAYFGFLQSGDRLVGYDSANVRMITYSPLTGQVAAYDPGLVTRTPLYTITTNSIVTWSNYLHQVFAAHWNGIATSFYTFNGSTYQYAPSTINSPATAVATSAYAAFGNAYATNGSYIYAFNLSGFTLVNSGPAPYAINALATNDLYGYLYTFNSVSPYISRFNESLTGSSTSSNFGFGTAPLLGATDTDAGDVYAMGANEIIQASNISGVSLPGFGNQGPGGSVPVGLVVVSTDQ